MHNADNNDIKCDNGLAEDHDCHNHEASHEVGVDSHHNSHVHKHAFDHKEEFEEQKLTIRAHEGALIASSAFIDTKDVEESSVSLKNAMEELAEGVCCSGGIVGHIKASIKPVPQATTLSTTGGQVSIRNPKQVSCHITFVAIIFGIDEKTLEELLLASFA